MTLPKPDAHWALDDHVLGRRVSIYNQLDSTNTFTLAHAHDPGQHGLVVLAREQTAGRGQHGRSWQAPAGSSVLMSFLLFPPPHLRRPALLTAWAAVSVCEAIGKIANLQAAIKWPNDVLIRGKKVCGILIEQRTNGNTEFPLASVVGICLNVTQSAEMFAQAQVPDACSLSQMAQRSFGFEEVARALIAELDAQYAALVAGDFADLETQWRQRLGLLGKMVGVEGVNQIYRGRLLDVTLTTVELEIGGELLRLTPESVKHLRPDMPQ
jgi:BirA family transcriptional regulator, biotin operon repressor / biotin---[acetyl-CoA-carboxylase] ligase